MEITEEKFGLLKDGRVATAYTLQNDLLKVQVTNYGVRLLALTYLETEQSLVLGYPSLADYESDDAYLGAVVGRTCNRIKNASFEMEGQRYELEANEGVNQLHGGHHGYHNRLWQVSREENGLLFSLDSPAGDAGYPGNVSCSVLLSLQGAALRYDYRASTDQPTIVDLTNHAYFCLDDSGSILNHELLIHSDAVAEVDEALIPTGHLIEVSATPFDFTSSRSVGGQLAMLHPQLKLAAGIDHSYLLRDGAPAATLSSALSGVAMSVTTSLPALQVYTGNVYPEKHAAICLETQHMPNAINQEGFAAPVLMPESPMHSFTQFEFSRL